MKYRGFTAESVTSERRSSASPGRPGCTELMLTPAASTIVRRADDSLDATVYAASVAFARDRVKKRACFLQSPPSHMSLPAIPRGQVTHLHPLQDEGSLELLGLATSLEPLEPRGRGW